MPELPEVAALVDTLDGRMTGLIVARVEVASVNVLKTFDPPLAALHGAAILGLRRAGKHLIVEAVDVDGQPLCLVVHLSRAGWIRWREDMPRTAAGLRRTPARGAGAGLALRVVLVTPDGEPAGGIDVTEAGTQKRLAVHLVRDPQQVPAVAALGPDPLAEAFDFAQFRQLLATAGRAQIKGVLRDQTRIAGIGNAYSDEILHAAGVSPFAAAGGLAPEVQARLFEAMKSVLAEAVAAAARTDPTSLKAEKKASMRVHGRAGERCGQCGDVIREVSFADSSLQYCPTCQTQGRILADRRMSRLLK